MFRVPHRTGGLDFRTLERLVRKKGEEDRIVEPLPSSIGKLTAAFVFVRWFTSSAMLCITFIYGVSLGIRKDDSFDLTPHKLPDYY